MMSQNFANTKNVAEEKNEMENLNESLFAKIENYLDLKKQYFCCCNINIWMLTIAAITIFTAVKTQILLLVTDDFTDNVINFIFIFPVWISGIFAILAYIFKMPLLIWPFIVYLVSCKCFCLSICNSINLSVIKIHHF
ncbi:unnamed protein product [Brugia timori]|uniref:Uncharacterized protein n=1 Tax=Brugia timori TaxID=42155 RepID=A0A0R3R5V7_9BILA|nr:unnamed protein product [Brugia timori]